MSDAYLMLLSNGYLTCNGVSSNLIQLQLQRHISLGRDDQRSEVLVGFSQSSLDEIDPTRYISGLHCTIFYDSNKNIYQLIDNHSRNGTRLNNIALQKGKSYPLKSGSFIELGLPPNTGALLRFHLDLPINQKTNITHIFPPPPTSPPPILHTSSGKTGPLRSSLFLSYSREDLVVMNGLTAYLEQANILPDCLHFWVDKNHLQVGEIWQDEIGAAIRNSAGVILLVSQASLNSEWVKREISFAMHHKKKIFALQIGSIDSNSIFFGLQDVQWIDFQKVDYKKGLDELIIELRKLC